jgi:hypothetical protein
MKRFFVLMLVLASTGWAVAGERNKRPRPPANGSGGVETKDAGTVVPSGVVERRVEKLQDELHWSTSLDEAKADAKRQNKPIFWIHLLGDLDGEC